MIDAIVADVNPLLSSLLGGRSRDVLFCDEAMFYSPQQLIGQRDPKDVHVLALALQSLLPIWTDDRDFEGLPDVTVYKTAQLLELIGA